MNKDLYWPLGITAVLVVFVGFLVSVIIFSRTIPENLVAEDYYQNSISYQEKIDRITRTNALQKSVEIQYSEADEQLTILYPQLENLRGFSGTLILFRPSDALQDIKIPIQVDNDFQQKINTAPLNQGLWRIYIYWDSASLTYFNEDMFMVKK